MLKIKRVFCFCCNNCDKTTRMSRIADGYYRGKVILEDAVSPPLRGSARFPRNTVHVSGFRRTGKEEVVNRRGKGRENGKQHVIGRFRALC